MPRHGETFIGGAHRKDLAMSASMMDKEELIERISDLEAENERLRELLREFLDPNQPGTYWQDWERTKEKARKLLDVTR